MSADLLEDDTPERIWAGDFNTQGFGHCVRGMQGGLYAEYVRVDLAVPDSFVLIPKEPTREFFAAMGDAIVKIGHCHHDKIAADLYAAIIATATGGAK